MRAATEKQVKYFNGLYNQYYSERLSELTNYGTKKYEHDNAEFELICAVRKVILDNEKPTMKAVSLSIQIMKEYLF